MKTPLSKIMESYPFLDESVAREAFIFDVLNELITVQKSVEKGQSRYFATKDHMYKSRAIKMPFTPSRDKNILFLLDLLTSRYPEYITTLIHFEISVDEKSKKLNVKEIEEYCYSLASEEIERLQKIRDEQTRKSISDLISKFRVFNLTRLMNEVQNKKPFNRVLQKMANRDIFIYKNVEIRNNKFSPTMEICFHSKNYAAVKSSLNLQSFKTIMANYQDMINPRLRNYGIMNADFSDYKENKIDYILHIMLEDLKSTLTPKDSVLVANFKSLRDCIIRVENALDPVKVYNNEILTFIRRNRVSTASDIAASILSIDESVVRSWATEDQLKKEKIQTFKDASGTEYYAYCPVLMQEFKNYYNLIRYDQDKFEQLSPTLQKSISVKLNGITEIVSRVSAQSDAPAILKISKEDIESLLELIEEYQAWLKQKELRKELSSEELRGSGRSGRSVFGVLINAIKSLFGIFSRDDISDKISSNGDDYSPISTAPGSSKKPLTKEAKTIYAQTRSRKAPILALSEFIVLSKENDKLVDQIINDMRQNNLKIIMPVYNARKVLYPKRSSKLLIPDIEYLLIDPAVIRTSESITNYVDSLVGFKLKDDIISGTVLINIEKYLRNIQRQQKAKLRIKRAQHQHLKNKHDSDKNI
ncbi:MAG: hypothetical protein JXK07_02215 [Spirochaetes bacterium]|nr:hypothetical protein [Spirochaetota bacterium]MBN2771868.1 hypothetical protein [Spirochaetota bacterium]